MSLRTEALRVNPPLLPPLLDILSFQFLTSFLRAWSWPVKIKDLRKYNMSLKPDNQPDNIFHAKSSSDQKLPWEPEKVLPFTTKLWHRLSLS